MGIKNIHRSKSIHTSETLKDPEIESPKRDLSVNENGQIR